MVRALLSIVAVLFCQATAIASFGVLYSFAGGNNDGAFPLDSLTLSGSTLFGMTGGGGPPTFAFNEGGGTIYQYDLNASKETMLYAFKGSTSDGGDPISSLTQSGNALYGSTNQGGAVPGGGSGAGTIVQYDIATHSESVLHSFSGGTGDGSLPTGPLTPANSVLFGTTTADGAGLSGTIYSYNTLTNAEYVVYALGRKPMTECDRSAPCCFRAQLSTVRPNAADHSALAQFTSTTSTPTLKRSSTHSTAARG